MPLLIFLRQFFCLLLLFSSLFLPPPSSSLLRTHTNHPPRHPGWMPLIFGTSNEDLKVCKITTQCSRRNEATRRRRSRRLTERTRKLSRKEQPVRKSGWSLKPSKCDWLKTPFQTYRYMYCTILYMTSSLYRHSKATINKILGPRVPAERVGS